MDEAYSELVKEALLRKLSGAKAEAFVGGVKRIGGAIASGAKKFGEASQRAMGSGHVADQELFKKRLASKNSRRKVRELWKRRANS